MFLKHVNNNYRQKSRSSRQSKIIHGIGINFPFNLDYTSEEGILSFPLIQESCLKLHNKKEALFSIWVKISES